MVGLDALVRVRSAEWREPEHPKSRDGRHAGIIPTENYERRPPPGCFCIVVKIKGLRTTLGYRCQKKQLRAESSESRAESYGVVGPPPPVYFRMNIKIKGLSGTPRLCGIVPLTQGVVKGYARPHDRSYYF